MSKRGSNSNDRLIKTLEDEVQTFEALYLKEQTKSYWLIGVSATLAVALIVSLFTSPFASDDSDAVASTPIAATTPFGGGLGGGAGGGFSPSIDDFFLDDGSVDTDRLAIFENVPSQFRSQILDRIDDEIDDALASSEITADQADQLYDALNDL